MNAFAQFPTRLHWNAQQLADAVPLRLHELFAFDAAHDAACREPANAARRRARGNDYQPRSPLPARFGIR